MENDLMDYDALILVDIQNDFLSGGALAVPDGDAVIAVANRLAPHFRLVVATQDWHPANHGSFAANHPGTSVGQRVPLEGIQQVLWPVHCVQETHAAALASGLEDVERFHRVYKGQQPKIDSYSGFFDNDHHHATALDDLLRHRGVRRVYIMGLATDYCVKATALDAARLGFDTYVVADGCRGVGLRPQDVGDAMLEMIAAGVSIITSNGILGCRRVRAEDAGGTANSPPRQGSVSDDVILAETAHLQLVRRGNWSFVRRSTATTVAAILAVTADNELLLVEQHRPPVNGRVIELPAGLVGDIAGAEDETLEQGAKRELLEETGYEAQEFRHVFTGPSSAGLTDETISFVVATDLARMNDGGGDQYEDIQVHRVPLSDVDTWLRQKHHDGCLIDARVPTGVYLLTQAW